MKLIIVLFYVFSCSPINAYSLSESEYNLMPQVIHVDLYDECTKEPDSLYCYVKFTLVSDSPSPLMDMIHNYSSRTHYHYDHSTLRYGICVSKTCPKFQKNMDLDESLEGCLNETFWRTHKLKTKIQENAYCNIHQKKPLDRNIADTIIGAICIAIFMANIVGSMCDNFFPKLDNKKDGQLLSAFSITRNWKKLVSPGSESDPRIIRLQSIYGFRVIATLMVIITHSGLPTIFVAKNKQYIEEMYGTFTFRVIQGKPLSMQIFLQISGFLMVYLGLVRAEKQPVTWGTALRMVRMRLLRLVPTYTFMLGLTATWLRIENAPPYAQEVIKEGEHCRRYWWTHLLFINNHFNHSNCMKHSWYIATDTQLYCVGAVTFVLCRTERLRRLLLGLLSVAAMLLVAAETYLLDLEAIPMVSPEGFLNVLMHNLTIQFMYMQPYSYIPGYMVSFCLAYYMYHWQKNGIQEDKLRKYHPALMAVVIGIVALGYTGSIFYEDRPRDPMYVRVLYASLAKPIYAVLLAAFIAGTMLRIDRRSSGFLEWRWWRSLSQLSLSVYLVHMPYLLSSVLTLHSPIHITMWTMAWGCIKTITVSYLLAMVLWLLIEAPAGNLVDHFMKTPEQKEGVEQMIHSSEINECDKGKRD